MASWRQHIKKTKKAAVSETSNSAIDGGLAEIYDLSEDLDENPEERYPIVQDPPLVRAAQLACLRLVYTLPPANKAEYAIKMFESMEGKFNHLLRQRTRKVHASDS